MIKTLDSSINFERIVVSLQRKLHSREDGGMSAFNEYVMDMKSNELDFSFLKADEVAMDSF